MSKTSTSQLTRSAQHLRELIRCPSITPEEGGALDYLERELSALGFSVDRVTFSGGDSADVDNLYARIGNKAPHLCFAGHTDVVPTGNQDDWALPPFSGEVKDGMMFGRGAVDMKGGIACFMAAVEAYLKAHGAPKGSVSLLITGDEEGHSVNGTDKLLQWAAEKGETWDAAIVGEPSNSEMIGDVIKNGRRGSLSGKITVHGIQGHSAYPHLADNPVRGMIDLLNALLATPFDDGTDQFQPTHLEVTSVDVDNPAVNVIAGKAIASFNIRFNDKWDGDSIRTEILQRLELGANSAQIRPMQQGGEKAPVKFSVEWIGRVSPVFITSDEKLVSTLTKAIEAVTGKVPALSTGGGTSDARFIKDYCPVVEFGLVGKTMHQVDERTTLSDLDRLTAVYLKFMEDYFA